MNLLCSLKLDNQYLIYQISHKQERQDLSRPYGKNDEFLITLCIIQLCFGFRCTRTSEFERPRETN